jgi:hypothetical protein
MMIPVFLLIEKFLMPMVGRSPPNPVRFGPDIPLVRPLLLGFP